ncbi:hypothetical protein OH687_37730 [Burkholderia anthina]|nr:hypothetical protein OH687_37730 [Burkholderia anthina]
MVRGSLSRLAVQADAEMNPGGVSGHRHRLRDPPIGAVCASSDLYHRSR